ncbi:hypothetical protein [Campylobacter sputorum]|uniref:hypothetical protein n=1 Tax=Campylobacter sputorum TaxID=206 RepID=UPI001E2D52B1|nr:hypothetical protein [Campylobacter sputorum]
MIEFFLTNYYSIDKPLFFLGFLFGICVAGLFFKYRKTSTFETKNLKCIVFKDDKKLVTPVEVILKDAKPHFTICPFF